MLKKLKISLLVLLTLFATSATTIAFADDDCDERDGYKRVEVSGTAIHDFNTVILHREKTRPNGVKKTVTTETIDLSGDLEGRVLYQPVGVLNEARGTLVNTGRQVFSGTILGSRPVMLFDDEFRFEVNFFLQQVRGEVYLSERLSGPRIACELEIIGGDQPPVDNRTFSTYSGFCWIRKKD